MFLTTFRVTVTGNSSYHSKVHQTREDADAWLLAKQELYPATRYDETEWTLSESQWVQVSGGSIHVLEEAS